MLSRVDIWVYPLSQQEWVDAGGSSRQTLALPFHVSGLKSAMAKLPLSPIKFAILGAFCQPFSLTLVLISVTLASCNDRNMKPNLFYCNLFVSPSPFLASRINRLMAIRRFPVLAFLIGASHKIKPWGLAIFIYLNYCSFHSGLL